MKKKATASNIFAFLYNSKSSLAALGSLVIMTSTTSAIDLYWDLNGSGAGGALGGNPDGTWSDADVMNRWTTNTAGTGTQVDWGNGTNNADVAVLAAGADANSDYDITLDGHTDSIIHLGGLRIDDNLNANFTAGTAQTLRFTATGADVEIVNNMSFGSNVTVDVASGGTLDLLSGNYLFNAGSSLAAARVNLSTNSTILRQGAANTISTGTVVQFDPNAGSAQFLLNGFNASIGGLSGSGIVELGARDLTLNNTINETFTGSINGDLGSSLIKSGTANQILGNTSSLRASDVTINEGSLIVAANAGNSVASAITITGGSLRVNKENYLSDVQPTINLSGTAGTLVINNVADVVSRVIGTGTVNLPTASSVLTLNASSASTFAGNFTGVGTAEFLSSTYTLTGTSSAFTGAWRLNTGAIVIPNAGSAIGATGSRFVLNGGELRIPNAARTTNANLIVATGSSQITEMGTNSAFTTSGNLSFASGGLSLNLMGSDLTVNGVTTLASGTNGISVATGASLTLGDTISGASSILDYTGPGTLTLNGSSTYGGGSILNTGTINVGSNAAFGTGKVSSDGNTIFNTTAARTITPRYYAFNANPSFTGTGGFTFDGNFTGSAGSTLTVNTPLTINGELGLTGGNVSGQTLTFNGSSPIVVMGSIRDTIIDGDFTVNSFNNNNLTYAGTSSFRINSAPSNTTANGTLTNAATGTLIFSGLGGWQGNLTNFGDVMFDFDTDRTWTTPFAGNNVNFTGTANTTLNATLSHLGTTTVQNGTLNLNAGALSAASGLTLNNSGDVNVSQPNRINDSAHVSIDSLSNLSFNQTNGAETIGGLSGAGNLIFNNNYTLTYGDTSDRTFSGTISGNAGSQTLNLQGSGIKTLSNANTFTGSVNLNGGSLALRNNSALGNTANSLTTAANTFLLAAGAGVTRTVANPINILGTVTFSATENSSNTFNLTGAVSNRGVNNLYTITTPTTFTGGLALSHDSTPRNIIIDSSAAVTLSSLNAGPAATGAIAKNGTGALTISNAVSDLINMNVNAGTVNFASNYAGNVAAAAASIINLTGSNQALGSISGAGTYNKSGSGTLTTTGSSSFSGTFNLNNGGVAISDPSFSGTLATTAGTTVTLNGGGNGVFSGSITGPAPVTKSGAGGAWVTGDNTGTGALTINAGQFRIGNNTPTGSWASAITNNGVGLYFNRNNGYTHNGVISGTAPVVQVGDGTTTLGGNNTFTGDVVIQNGALTLGHVNALGVNATILMDATLNLNGFSPTVGSINYGANLALGASTLTIGGGNKSGDHNGIISGTGGITKIGTGSAYLGGASTATGTLAVNAGLVRLAAEVGSWAGPVVIGSNASLEFVRDTNANFNSDLSGSGRFLKTGIGTSSITNAADFTGTLEVDGGTLRFSNPAAVPTGLYDLNLTSGIFSLNGLDLSVGSLTGGMGGTADLGAKTLTVGADNSTFTYAGSLSGTGIFAKSGTGSLTLNGDNSAHTGNVTVNNGHLLIQGGSALPDAGTLALASGSNLTFNAGSATSETIGALSTSGTGSVTIGTGRSLTIAGTSASSIAHNIAIESTASFVKSGASTLTVNGVISGAGSLTHNGSGNLRLNANNSFTGGVTLSAGLVVLGSDSALGTGMLNYHGGVIETSADRTLTNAIFVAGDRSLSTNHSLTLNGIISGTGTLSKSTTSDLTLNAANTFIGGLNFIPVSAANLTLGNSAALGPARVTLSNAQIRTSAANLSFANNMLLTGYASFRGTQNFTSTGIITGAGDVYKEDTNTVTLTGANTFTGGSTLRDGTLVLGSNTALGTGTLNYNGGTIETSAARTLANSIAVSGARSLSTTHALTLNGIVSGTGSLEKSTTSALTLNGANTFSGGLSFSPAGAANLTLGNSSAFGTGAVTLANAQIRTNAANLSFANNMSLTGYASFRGTENFTSTGVISGAGDIYKEDANTVTLTGANTFTGGSTLRDGALVLGSNSALGTGSLAYNGGTIETSAARTLANAIAVSGARSLSTTHALTLNGIVSGTGSLSKSTASDLTLNGPNSFSGGLSFTPASAANLTFGSNTAFGAGTTTLANANLRAGTSGLSLANGLNMTGATTLRGTNPFSITGVISGTGALTKADTNTVTLTGVNTYTGSTAVNAGTLVVNGSTHTSSAFTINSGATLAGSGTIGGAASFASGSIHSPGNSPGIQTFSSSVTYNSGSIFEWDLAGNVNGAGGTRGTHFDAANVTGNLSIASGATFKVVQNAGADFNNAFWNTNQTWSNVWNVSGSTTSGWTNASVSVFNTSDVLQNVASRGAFSITGTTLSWTAVPEASNLLIAGLLGLGIMSRRRSQNKQ